MTNTILLIVLLSTTGIVLVYGECQTNDGPIESCCSLGYNNTYFNTKSSGVYTIGNFCGVKCSNTKAYCDTTSGGGGWLVVQRRDRRYHTTFHRAWTEYADGFGDLYKEFWFGLNAMYCLTNTGNWELRIDFTFDNGTKSFMHYNHFRVGPATDNYRLSVSGFTGITPIDPFTSLNINGQQFTTYDRDNDQHNSINCALNGHGAESGGWWHKSCNHINPNYNYNRKGWGFFYLGDGWYDPNFIEMKIRPVDCKI